MDGVKCTHIGCNCHDFLPFTCPLCEQVFCLQHRSRFSHNPCAVSNMTLPKEIFCDDVTAAAAKEAQNMLDSVESRFESTASAPSATHALNVRTAAIPEEAITSQKKIATLEKLKNIENKSSSATERKLSSKTRQILIKSNSIGNSSIPAADRIYFSGRFLAIKSGASGEDVGDVVNFFYKRSMTLGEMLHQLGTYVIILVCVCPLKEIKWQEILYHQTFHYIYACMDVCVYVFAYVCMNEQTHVTELCHDHIFSLFLKLSLINFSHLSPPFFTFFHFFHFFYCLSHVSMEQA